MNRKNMKIIAISLFFKPIWPGHGNRIPQMFLESIQNESDIIVLTGKIPNDIQQNFDCKTNKITQKYLWIPKINYETIFGKFLTNSIFFIQCFFYVLFSKKFDLILCFLPYLPFFSLAILPAKLRKIKSIIIYGDAWPEVLKDLGVIKNKILYKIISKICIGTINQSSKILSLTTELKYLLISHNIDANKIVTINHGIDVDIFKPDSSQKKSKFLVIFTGTFSPLYDFNMILKTAEKLKNHDINFELIGDGPLKNNILNFIKNHSLDNVVVIPPIKNTNELIKKINSANLGIISIIDNIQNNSTHPNKILEYLSCGLPIICRANGAPKQLLLDSKGGIVVDQKDHNLFVKYILELFQDTKKCNSLGENGRKYILSNHSIHDFKKQFLKTISELK